MSYRNFKRILNESDSINESVQAIINRHGSDFIGTVKSGNKVIRVDFTIEFDVKNMDMGDLDTETANFEFETGEFANIYADRLFEDIRDALSHMDIKGWDLVNWSFAGRSNGWFALLCVGDPDMIKPEQMKIITDLVKTYKDDYTSELMFFYREVEE
jgi:hypothetical protein